MPFCTAAVRTGLALGAALAALAPPTAWASPANVAIEHDYDRRLVAGNGDIFWAPASGFTGNDHWPNVFGDEARSVFGPLPAIDCARGRIVHAEVEGNRVEALDDPERGHVFVHRSASGSVDEVGSVVDECDKPSLANTAGHPCSAQSRLVHTHDPGNPNVDWVALCRKSEAASELTSWGGYWERDNSWFALLGMIGFNRATGEVVFIDGHDRHRGARHLVTFSWDEPYPPPGGSGYGDTPGRRQAARVYDYEYRIECETCHDNKEPWIMTPHLKFARVGYLDPLSREAFASPTILPLVQPRSQDSPYRVIGTRFTREAELTSRTFRDPTGSCTACHTLTTGWTGKVLAYDAVGRANREPPYRAFFERIERVRTPLGRFGGGAHPWMVPGRGPDVLPDPENGAVPPGITDGAWQRVAACIAGDGGGDCDYRNAFTACPAPESSAEDCDPAASGGSCARLGDPFGPGELAVARGPVERNASSQFDTSLIVEWSYLNGLGAVPRRDDVRFNLAVREVAIPVDGDAAAADRYPGLQLTVDPYHADEKLRGRIHTCDLTPARTRTCHVIAPEGTTVINNISFKRHLRNTVPEPAAGPRAYRVELPARCNRRYLFRLVPKRFCFDRSGVLAGRADHLAFFDARCP